MLICVQRAAHAVESSEGLCCFTGTIIQHERPDCPLQNLSKTEKLQKAKLAQIKQHN